nr:hypothetical protein [Ktedonobacteraceae bacterium]
VFGVLMTLVAGSIYGMIKQTRSTGAALTFVVYLLIGCWATALARFDLIPAGLTLAAAILAQRDRWKWAFVLLALAILFKFYPLVLLPVFFIAQQRRYRGDAWYAWRRWDGIALCICICVLVMAVSLALSVDGTLSAFAYFKDRPIQIESVAAGWLWLGHFVGYPLHYIVSFGSHNVLSPLSAPLSLLLTLSDIAGLLYLYWLQWRDKLDIFTACLLALLITLVTGKVFSPQYLLWVVPFVAYVGANNGKWLLSWGLVGLLTTVIYPFLYALSYSHSYATPLTHIGAFYPSVLLRGLTLLGIVCALFYQAITANASGARDLTPSDPATIV